MSNIGKLLVVVQVALSVLFMAFAGAVYSTHQNWRAKFDDSQKKLSVAQTALGNAQGELTNVRRESETKLAEETQKSNELNAKNITLTTQLVDLRSKNESLVTEHAAQTGLAESKADEAKFRQEESERQRIENTKLQATLDRSTAETRELRDQLTTLQERFRQLNRVYEAGLGQVAYLKKVVATNGLETDPEVVEKLMAPPPPVEGIVKEVRKDRTNRVKFVEITIGSDDGLVKGNELDVIRIVGQDRSEWLGRVKLVDLYPDYAVGEVVLPSKNGIIKEGDNVTTKLGL